MRRHPQRLDRALTVVVGGRLAGRTVAIGELLTGPIATNRVVGLSAAVLTGTRLLGINLTSSVATVPLQLVGG